MIIQYHMLVLFGLLPLGESNDWVKAHNVFRCMHGMPDVTWNTDLARGAEAWAHRIHPRLKHDPSLGGTGENLAAGTSFEPDRSKLAVDAVAQWYGEIENWTAGQWSPAHSFSSDVGHMTQVLWRDTREIGCYVKVDEGGGGGTQHTEVCRYLPGGNVDTRDAFEKALPRSYVPVKSQKECEAIKSPGGRSPVVRPPSPSSPAHASPTHALQMPLAWQSGGRSPVVRPPSPSSPAHASPTHAPQMPLAWQSPNGNRPAFDADNEFLRAHNMYRCMLGIPGVTWSTELAEYARKHNEAHNGRGIMDHTDSYNAVNAGENLAYGEMLTPAGAVGAWYNERVDKNKPGAVLGHFTTMAWFDVTEIGCSDYKHSQMCNYRSGPERGGIPPSLPQHEHDTFFEYQVKWTETRSQSFCEGAADAGYGAFHASPFESDRAGAATAGFIVMIILSAFIGLAMFGAGYMQYREYIAAQPRDDSVGKTRRKKSRKQIPSSNE